MEFMDIMFATPENCNGWIYGQPNWEQTKKDLNIRELIEHFEKNHMDFPIEYLEKPCLKREDAEYRLEIMEELGSRGDILEKIKGFCDDMRAFRKLYRDMREEKHETQKQYRFVLAFGKYIENLCTLKETLSEAGSAGLRYIRSVCSEITGRDEIVAAYNSACSVIRNIGDILEKTGLHIKAREKMFSVTDCTGPSEAELLREELLDAYGLKAKPGFSVTNPAPLSFLEEKVLHMLVEADPEVFDNLRDFHEKYGGLAEDMRNSLALLPQFVFYTAYLEFAENAKRQQTPLCRPVFDEGGFFASECAGVGLLVKFMCEGQALQNITKNAVRLPKGGVFILSGPNQGGKTIYLKMLGTTAYLAKCGCFVFCSECRLPFYDGIFTHFMQKETLGKSRLAEEVERMEQSAASLSCDTLVLLNESFTSTRRKNSVKIAVHYLKKLEQIRCSVGFVSHFYEIPEIYDGGKNSIISLRCKIGEGGERTYEIHEKKGDGLAYAKDIARSCGMTYEQIIGEIRGAAK